MDEKVVTTGVLIVTLCLFAFVMSKLLSDGEKKENRFLEFLQLMRIVVKDWRAWAFLLFWILLSWLGDDWDSGWKYRSI